MTESNETVTIDIPQLKRAMVRHEAQNGHCLHDLDCYIFIEAAGAVIGATPMVRMGGLTPAWYPQDADDTEAPDGWLIMDLGSQP